MKVREEAATPLLFSHKSTVDPRRVPLAGWPPPPWRTTRG